MQQLYMFQEHEAIFIGDKKAMLDFAEATRDAEGTIGDLRYQIKYAFDVDGIRSENTEDEFCNDPAYAEANYGIISPINILRRPNINL